MDELLLYTSFILCNFRTTKLYVVAFFPRLHNFLLIVVSSGEVTTISFALCRFNAVLRIALALKSLYYAS